MTTYKSRIRTKKFLSIFIEFNHNFRENNRYYFCQKFKKLDNRQAEILKPL